MADLRAELEQSVRMIDALTTGVDRSQEEERVRTAVALAARSVYDALTPCADGIHRPLTDAEGASAPALSLDTLHSEESAAAFVAGHEQLTSLLERPDVAELRTAAARVEECMAGVATEALPTAAATVRDALREYEAAALRPVSVTLFDLHSDESRGRLLSASRALLGTATRVVAGARRVQALRERAELLLQHVECAKRACSLYASIREKCAAVLARREELRHLRLRHDDALLMGHHDVGPEGVAALRARLAAASTALNELLDDVLWFAAKCCPGGGLDGLERHGVAAGTVRLIKSVVAVQGLPVSSLAAEGIRVLGEEAPRGGQHRLGTTAEGQRVVIKTFALSDADARSRFSREAAVLRRLEHPGLIRPVALFVDVSSGTAEGVAVLPWYGRGDLRAAKSSPANPFADEASAVRVIDGVVDALLYLHSAGVLHGDVKPTNAVLTDGGAPLLIDFDAAVSDAEREAALTRALQPTRVRGTAGYVAPELLQGGAARPSWRTEVYALGATIDELTRGEAYRTPASGWDALIAAMKGDAEQRPTLAEVRRRVRGMCAVVFADQHAAVVAPLPLHWATDGAVPTLQPVGAEMAAFVTLARLLTESCRAETLGRGRDQVDRTPYRAIELVRAFRVEHRGLFKWYVVRRAEMRERLASRPRRHDPAFASTPHAAVLRPDELVEPGDLFLDVDAANECLLWHGTRPDTAAIIGEQGFDERVCALHGLFGAGVYFAEHSSKADQYCTAGADGLYTVLLSRVALGDAFYTSLARNGERRPPPLPEGGGALHDSVIGQVDANRYREFIVYDRAQTLPEYLLQYRRVR